MFMVQIADTPQFPMTIISITCTMGICTISMMTIGMSATSMVVLSTPNMSTNMDQIVVMSQSPMVITLTTYTTDIYTPPTATTGTNTKNLISGRGDARSPQVDRPLW